MPREGFNLRIRATTTTVKCLSPYYAIIITHDAKNDTLRERIYIGGLSFNKTGKIPLTYRLLDNSCDSIATANFGLENSGGDVTIGEYYLPKKSESFINIESYDATSKEIKGTFDITFVADGTSERVRRIYPDTVRFDKAKFSVIIN
jgi:hypothetical protein